MLQLVTERMIPFSRPLPHFLFGQQHSGTCHEVGHIWHPSCIYCFLEVFYYVYVGALKLYGPLYLVKCNNNNNEGGANNKRKSLTSTIDTKIVASMYQ